MERLGGESSGGLVATPVRFSVALADAGIVALVVALAVALALVVVPLAVVALRVLAVDLAVAFVPAGRAGSEFPGEYTTDSPRSRLPQ